MSPGRALTEDFDLLTWARELCAPVQEVGKGEDAQLPLTRLSRDPELGPASPEETLADRRQTLDQGVER